MPVPLPVSFGRSFGDISELYLQGVGRFLGPVFHVCFLVVFLYMLAGGRKFQLVFTLYFLINYVWIFVYVGVVMSVQFQERMGPAFLLFWGPVPLLLLFIVSCWISELRFPRNDFHSGRIAFYRFLVVPVMLFGFWYPTYVWGTGFRFLLADGLFSAFGLMPCPTTMVVLGLLTMKYPDVNKGLYVSLTLFAIMVGTAQVAIGYVPDYPLAFLGYYALVLLLVDKIRRRRTSHGTGAGSTGGTEPL